MRRYVICIEHYIGNTVIEHALLDSDARVYSGYLKEELCHGMITHGKQVDCHQGGKEMAEYRRGDHGGASSGVVRG